MKIKKFTVGGLDTNCYAVFDDCEKDLVIIDPGAPDEKLLEFVSENKDKLRAILLTHKHYDHIMGLNAVKSIAPGAEAIIHKADAAEMSDCNTNCYFDVLKEKFDFSSFKADRLIEDSEELIFGSLKFKAVHTPGHSKGGVCYICENSIFTGDTLLKNSIGNPLFMGGSINQLRDSLKKICSLKGDYSVYPGHGGETTLLKEKESNPHLRRYR